MARVHLGSALRQFTEGAAEVEVEAATVKALIAELDRQYPGIGERLGSGTAVAIDGEIMTNATYERLSEDTEVYFLPAISGG